MKNLALTLAILLPLVFLGACAPITPRVEQMTVATKGGGNTRGPDALKQNIFYLGGMGTVDKAIDASLAESNLRQKEAGLGRFILTAHLVQLDEPSFGLNMTVTATVRYTLKERGTERVVLDKTITTPYTAEFSTTLRGAERKKLAAEGAFRANIAQLMDALAKLSPSDLPLLADNAPTPVSAPAPAPPQIASSVATPQASIVAQGEQAPTNRNLPVEKVAAPVPVPPSTPVPAVAAVEPNNTPDVRAASMRNQYIALSGQARSGKIRYLQAARLYKDQFLKAYPEEVSNPVMNEYHAYMAVLGERVDRKRLTEVEAEYELARKERELAERVAAMRAQAATQAASAKAAEDNAARAVAEQVAVRKAGDEVTAVKAQLEAQRFEAERLEALRQEAAQLEAGRQQAALAAAIQSQAEEQRRTRAAAIFLEGMRLLTPPPPPKMTTCRWFAQNWVCM